MTKFILIFVFGAFALASLLSALYLTGCSDSKLGDVTKWSTLSGSCQLTNALYILSIIFAILSVITSIIYVYGALTEQEYNPFPK